MGSRIDKIRNESRKKAKKAINKKALYGTDLDLSVFKSGIHDGRVSIDLKSRDFAQKLSMVGVDITEKNRSGSYYQVDNVILSELSKHPGVEVMSIEEAFEQKGEEILEYYWRAVSVDKDKYTAAAELIGRGGYVIWVKKGTKVDFPIQTCLVVLSDNIIQAPHNIIIAEPGAEVTVITGCMVMRENIALHLGVSEFYVKENAKIMFVMIHGWNENMHVRARTGVVVESGGTFISHYINMAPVASLQTYPTVKLIGENARAHLSTIIIGKKRANIDVGGEISFEKENTKGEVISRTIGLDNSKIISRGRLVGRADNIKGHLECKGLLLSDKSEILTIPELASSKLNVELTHEASIGKLAEDEILYLMARGFSKDEAEALLVRGFMRVEIEGLPKHLQSMIDKTINMLSKQAL